MVLGAGIAPFGCESQDGLVESAVEPPAREELRVEEIAIGDGPECQSPSDILTLHYRGMLLDGHVFDSSYRRGAPIVASLRSLIPGWQQGMPGMRVGGIRRLTVPSGLAYSGMAALQAVDVSVSRGAGEVLIPPESTLVFEIELLAVDPGEASERPSDVARSAGD